MTFKRADVTKFGDDTWVFFAEWNAPKRRITSENAPPAFAHINIFVGDVANLIEARSQPAEGAISSKRDALIDFGQRTWNERTGTLLLAPPYPLGGIEGDHLIFRWSEHGQDYSMSLHA